MTSRHWTSRKGVTAFVVGSECMSWPVRALSSGVFLFCLGFAFPYVFPSREELAHLRFVRGCAFSFDSQWGRAGEQ